MPDETITTISTIKRIPFLNHRLEGLVSALLTQPQNTVLWVGAGLSAKYGGLPTWTGFLRAVLESTIPPRDADYSLISSLIASGRLSIAAECLQEILGGSLFDTLKSTFGSSKGRLPMIFSYLSAREIICTNYDTLLECVMPWYDVVLPSHGIDRLLSREQKIVKIHGTILEPSSCVLSLSSYIRAYNLNLQWYLANVFSTCSVIFIGTSMSPIEPYFRALNLIRNGGRPQPEHWSIMSVPNSDAGREHGKRLERYGINLVPYIPDKDHSFIDQLLQLIDKRRGDSSVLKHRLQFARSELGAGRAFQSAITLWHASHASITEKSDRRFLGDTMHEFFIEALSGSAASELVSQCVKYGVDLAQLWNRYADLIIPVEKTLHGLRQSLMLLKKATGEEYPLLLRRCEELETSLATTRPRR